jgi:3-methylcrotonyl-CoA carboxylase alpha subunit
VWLAHEEQVLSVEARAFGEGHELVMGKRRIAAAAAIRPDGLAVRLDGIASKAMVVEHGAQLHLLTEARHVRIDRWDPLAHSAVEDEGEGALSAPMPGRIVRQPVASGDRVARGAPLLVLEAMKMEHTVIAPCDGRVVHLHYAEGDQVDEGVILIDFEPVQG